MASRLATTGQRPPGNGGDVDVGILESWFKGEGSSVHGAYGVETYYSAEKSRFIPGAEPPVLILKKFLVSFGQFQVSNSLNTTLNDRLSEVPPPTVDLLNCSWDVVLGQLETAKSESPKSSKRPSQRADRFAANVATYIEPWLELVPDEYGLGVVRGGLTLLFANRDKIIQTFESIPQMIRTMDTACKVFGRDKDENILDIAKSFYDQLCRDIPVLVQILNGKRKGLVRAFNRIAGCTPETEEIDDVLKRTSKTCSDLEDTVKRIKWKLDAKTQAEIQAIRSRLEDTNMGIAHISGQVGELASRQDIEQFTRNSNRDMAQFANELGSQMIKAMRQELRHEVQSIVKDQSALDPSALEFAAKAKTMVLRMAQENSVLREHVAAQRRQIESSQPRLPSPLPTPALSDLGLMQTLDVDPRSWTDDLASVLKQASRMDTDSKARARWLMKTPSFQNWVGVPCSSLLLAVGALRPERVSPLSVLASTIVLGLLELPDTLVLHFFCGMHLDADAEDQLSGPSGMLRSLIAQLVMAYKAPLPNLGAIGSPEFIYDVYNRRLDALCEVFRLLVAHVPEGVNLFVLIDGVSWYEKSDWLFDLKFILGLFKVLSEPARIPRFKVLLTSPSRTSEVQNLVDLNSEYVSLAPGNMDYRPLVSYSLVQSMFNRD
ncbi:hypothetical protein PG993_009120 [Apiospora rasikravindrae]|uniref:Nephrocystin 3-like N-terminal domain-containing protein n=1 Tax=Apiospora rasikravindrae TaxID=990691 RepID=A0ABR1SII0_9PEZI